MSDIAQQLQNFRNNLSQDRVDRVAALSANPFDVAKKQIKLILAEEEKLRITKLKKINFIGKIFNSII